MANPTIDQIPVLELDSPEPRKTKFDPKEYKRQYYQENKEQIQERQRRYNSTEQAKLSRKEILKRYSEKHRDQIKIRKSQYRAQNKERRNKYARQSREANREYFNEYYRKYYRNHKAKINERKKEWRRKNKEHIAAVGRRYRKTARGKTIQVIKSAGHRARKRFNSLIQDKAAIAAFVKSIRTARQIKCHWCKQFLEKSDRTIDHIIPLMKGGLHAAINLCCACQKCNFGKRDRLPQEISPQGFLPFI